MKNNKKYLIGGGVLLFIILTFVSYIYLDNNVEDVYLEDEEITTGIVTEDNFFVDVKGAVKKPGVYEFKNGERVFNAIQRAGGLLKTGNTSNINLSQKLKGEMVVYVYTNNEIKNGSNKISCSTICENNTVEVNNCYPEVNTNLSKVNINTGTLEDLITLSGIGESKAAAIINYRKDNRLFETIEDIKNVSGIGDSAFEKIKDKITI